MKNFERRIRKIEKELNMDDPDGSVWWENWKKRYPEDARITEEFFEKRKDDPDFVKERAEGGFSDKTINEFADYQIQKARDRLKDPEHRPLRSDHVPRVME